MHLDGLVLGDLRREDQPDAELAKLHCHGAGVGAALQYRHRELTPDQEVGFLAVRGHQVRLCQDL